MFKSQMKFQKILFPILLIVSAASFVYALGLMTDLYGLYQTKAMGGVMGSDLFYDMQGYNDILVGASIAMIVISCLPFVFASNSRRKYYKGNVISSYVQAAAFVILAVYILINTIIYRSRFVNEVDFASWEALAEVFSFYYSESTLFFNLGFVVAVVLIAAAFFVIYNLNWKTKLVNRENKILKGEIENE